MKKLATFLLLIVFLFAFAINVNAANETILNVSKNEVLLGEEIVLSIGLDTQNEEETSLYAYTAKLSYNKDVFEVITTEDFQEQESWSDINYNRANNKFALINKKGESGDKLLQIKLKVKEDAIPGETSITVNSIKASDGKKEIPLESKTVQVTVIKDGLAEGESLPSNKTEEPAVEENTAIEVREDSHGIGYLFIVLMIVVVLFLIYYMKMSRKNKRTRIIVIPIAIIILITLLIITINSWSNKKADVNADGVIDYDDTKEIIEYLLEIKNPQDDENIEDKDINKDGKVDITDVAGATNQATNQNHSSNTSGSNGNQTSGNNENNNSDPQKPTEEPTNPSNPTEPIKANIINSIITPYVEKGGIVEVIYTIEDNTDKEITNILINGTKLPVTKTEDGKYKLTFNAPNTRKADGKESIVATKIYYENEEVEINYALEIEILKSEPTIEDLYIDDSGEKPTLHFTLQDAEKTFVSGTITITNVNTNKEITIAMDGDVTQSYILNEIEELVEYKLTINCTYDLDTDKENGLNEYTKNLKEHNFEILKNYNLTLSDFKLKEINSTNVVLQFTSTNASKYFAEKVEIELNGVKHEYGITRNENVYTVEIPLSDINNARTEITLEGIILGNLKKFNKEADEAFKELNSELVFKTVPTATIGSVTVNDAKNEITANNITFTDTDSTITKKYAILKLNDEVIEEIEINSENSVTFKVKSAEIFKAGKYTIEVVADYDRVDGKSYEKEVLTEATVDVAIIATIKSDVTPIYAEKKEEIEVKYEIEANTEDKVINIEVNGTKYPTERTADGKYKITYTTGTTAGDEKLNVTSIEYTGGNAIVEYKSSVEILKDEPIIEKFNVDTSTSQVKATYDMVDNDSSFVSGRIIAKNTKTNEVIATPISADIREYTLNLVELEVYNVELEITYDRDSDNNNDKHQYTKVFETQKNIQFVKNYNLKLSDFRLDNIERDTLFNANIKFKATNASIYSIYGVIIDGKEYQVQPVEGEEDTYLIEYPYGQENIDVRKEIIVTDIVLTNDAIIKLENEQSVVIFKSKPHAQVLELKTMDNSNIQVQFELIDNDETVNTIYVVLQNEYGDVIAEQILSPDVHETKFIVSQSGTYKVVIKADYDSVDGLTHSEEELVTSDSNVEIKPTALVTTQAVTEKYPKKQETIEITYKIETNVITAPTKIVLNEKEEYKLTPVEGKVNEYKISYTAPNTSQIESLQVTKVYFGDDLPVNITDAKAEIIEVLKDEPTVTITSTDLLDQHAVLFNITVNDPDEAMISGTAKVHEQVKDLEKGQNNFLVTGINPDENHIISVEVQYDLDYNTIEKGKNESSINKEQEFRLISDYGFKINDIKAFNKDGKEQTYFAKNEPIELRFNCENKTEFIPDKVTIQDLKEPDSKGLEYNVNTIEDKNSEYRYYVDIVTNDQAGEQEFKIMSVTLDGSKILSEDKFIGENPTVLIEVVKTVPTMSDFTANNHEDSVTVEFNIKDDDKALQESYIVLTSGGSVVAKSERIVPGKNSYTFTNLTLGQKYIIKVENNYILRNDNKVYNEIFKEQEIEITKKEENNFRVKNLTITKRVPIDTKVNITFENSLMSYDDVDTIIIDNVEYAVTKGDNGIYKITLDPVKKGINKIHINGVKIKGKEFEIDRNLSYTYEYVMPVAKNVSEISEIASTSEAVINYQLEDVDKAVVELTAYMKNSAGTIIATKKIDLDNEETKIVKMDLKKVSTYSIELRATCDIGDGETYEEKTLFEKKREDAKPWVSILSQNIDKEYAEKGENVILTFKINTNVDQEVKKISIGDESYKVTKVTDEEGKVIEDTYSITVPAPSETGIFSQEISSIQIGSSLVDQIIYPNSTEPIKIKVYKQKPTITHFIIDENNNKVSFRVNDPDKSLVEPHPNFVIRHEEAELHTEELKNGESIYEFNLTDIGMTTIQNEYNVAVDVTYDLRPDDKESQNVLKKAIRLLSTAEEPSEDDTTEEEDPNAKYIIKENIFNENFKLIGKIEYNLDFEGTPGLFTLGDYQKFYFYCSTGTEYKVAKVIIDGREYPVRLYNDKGNGRYGYEGDYKAFSYNQNGMTFQKLILENGAALDIPDEDGWVYCMIIQTNPTFVIKDFIEDIEQKTVTFNFKLTDKDKKLYTNLTFTLMNSQGGKIGEQEVNPANDVTFNETGVLTGTVTFNVPYPPTAVYKLQVYGGLTEVPGYYDYLVPWTPINDEYQSSINTSILNSTLETRYPKKGETFAIDYVISSTKVILIDKDDHINQNKAVTITALVINGKDYDVQMLEDKTETYRVYYTAQNEDETEDINVTHIKFSNGDVEAFNHSDTIEVLKTAPYITNFRTENDLAHNKIKLSFVLNDPDGAIGTSDIKAKIGDMEKPVVVGNNNSVEFTVTPNQLLDLEIKATYDLDNNKLKDETNTNYNTYIDHTIFARKLMLTSDYKVTFNNIKTYNTELKDTKYFEKNEDIKLVFDCTTRATELYPEMIKIAGKEYELTKVPETENSYETIIAGSDIAQKVNAKIEDVTLNSGNVVSIENQTVEYETLKDHTKVSEFTYDISDSNADKVDLSIKLEDADKANKQTRIEVIDEYGHKVETTPEILEVGVNNVSFKKTEANKYTVSVYSTYDRDSNNTDEVNYYDNIKIHNQIVSLTTRYIEMKDIVDIKLYTFDDLGNAVRVDSLTEDNLNVVENCLVEVSMKTIPTFYSGVKKYWVEDNKLKLVLTYTDAMVYTGEDTLKPLEVTLDILENTQEYEYKGSFKSLVEQMRANNTVGAVINLDKDYDLLDYQLDDKQTAYIDFDYKGTLNANGHTISNLTKPLFKKLDGATIKNLAIKGVVFTGNDAKGAIAISATNGAKISNVHVENLVSPGNGTSALVYELTNNSIIEKSSATNITFNSGYTSQSIAAGVINMRNNSKIENCYVQGTIASGWWHNAGLVVDTDATCEISHNIVNMKISAYFPLTDNSYGHGCGGIVCSDFDNGKNTKGLTLKDNLSLVIGNGGVGAIYNPKRATLSAQSQNNYQLETATVKNESNGVITISQDKLNAEFFKNKLGLDTNIWNISDDASIDSLPVLKGVSNSYMDDGKRPENTEIYIPDYKRVSELESYKEDREITYHNMYKLMPFYDAKEIIRDGNKIPEGHDLTKKIIKYVVPFNKDGKMISNLTTENYSSLDKIYIVFEDGTKLTYNVTFDDYYGNVVSYMITELNIGYNYNKYVVNPQQDSVRRLIEVASSYDFRKDLDPVTTEIAEDSRLYKEHFDNYTKNHIEDFVINLLVDLGYSPNFDSDVLDDIIERELVKSGKLKEYLFAYNYFTYWYNLDMDGINLADSVMFHSSEMFDKDMTMEYLTKQLIQGSNSATNGIAGFYNNYFVKYTKISNLGLYLDYYVNTLTHYEDGDAWFRDNWKGGIYRSVNVDGADDLDYTLWDHLKKDGKVQTDILPLFTVPENSTFVMSSPSQAYFGSLRVYMTDPTDPEQLAKFNTMVEKWLGEVKAFYTFAYNYWGPNNINKYCDTNYDTRYTLTGKGDVTVYNKPLSTEEPYHKYFIEAINRWAGTSGGAYANGNEVFWVVIKMLSNFRVGTHETLHNQDSKIFLNGYGRRGNAEDYAAGFIQQYYRDGWVSPNIFDEEPVKDNTTQNLRKSSVENDEKLHEFYKNYFNVNDFLDWIEAKAYFTLTAEQKADISVQVSYPKVGPDKQDEGDDVVAYTPLTKDMVEKMELNNMQDLWKNKIMLRPGVKKYEERSPGADTDSIFNIHWYQPHADNDRPDGANFKYIAWQMAGEGGYYEGLVPYYTLSYIGIQKKTGEKTTDLTALRYIMHDDTITFETYKLGRYDKLSEHYDDVGTYIDAKAIYEEYLKALQTDANNKDRNLTQSTAVKKKYFQKIRLETNDFNIDPFSKKEKEISSVSLEEQVEISGNNSALSVKESTENLNILTVTTNVVNSETTLEETPNPTETPEIVEENTAETQKESESTPIAENTPTTTE